MRFAILGPVVVDDGDGAVAVAPGIAQSLLVSLLIECGRPVTADALMAAVWADRPPATAAESLRNHLTRLRRTLGPKAAARLRQQGHGQGYRIDVDRTELDLLEFQDLCQRGRELLNAGTWDEAATTLGSALALWRGEPLAGRSVGVDLGIRLQRLAEDHLLALTGRIEADLHLGRHQEVVGELRALAALQPLHEEVHRQLMLALARAGRPSEALATFRQLRGRLVEELAVEPSSTLHELYSGILNEAPTAVPADRECEVTATAPAEPTSAPAPEPAGRPNPAQLPPRAGHFLGREQEIESICAILADIADGVTGAATVVVSGCGGIGKTALALEVAHRMADRFPDGQLFADLCGAEPVPADPSEVLAQWLEAFGQARSAIPADPIARSALFRSVLKDRRVLIFADNACDAAQVAPLMPGAPGCLLLLTARGQLPTLLTAHHFDLPALDERSALQLLNAVIGVGRAAAEPEAVARAVSYCAGLPLALRIVGARLARRSSWRIAELVDRLEDERRRLDELASGDIAVRSAFRASYLSLVRRDRQGAPGDPGRVFRFLGLFPGRDFTSRAAAALLDRPLGDLERALEELADANLLEPVQIDRYRFHDLLRVYARELAELEESPEERRAASRRVGAWYLDAAQAANRLLEQRVRPGTPQLPTAASHPSRDPLPAPADRQAAIDWLRSERANLLAVVDTADDEPSRIALTAALAPFLHLDGPWGRTADLHRAAAEAAHALGLPVLEADALSDLGRVLHVSGRLAEAADVHERALAVYRSVGERHGEANALYDLGRIRHLDGQSLLAIDLHEQALERYRELGDDAGQAATLVEQGRARRQLGQNDAAAALFDQALASFRAAGNRLGEANTLTDLGYLAAMHGSSAVAVQHAEQALAAYREVGNAQGEGNALNTLGQILMAIERYQPAREYFELALPLHRDLTFRIGEAIALWGLGRVHLGLHAPDEAEACFARSLEIFRNAGHSVGEASVLRGLGLVARERGDQATAAELLGRALAVFRDCGDRTSEAEVLNDMAALTAATRPAEDALEAFRQAFAVAEDASRQIEQARALTGIADCLDRLGEHDEALAAARQAVEVYQKAELPDLGRAAQDLVSRLEEMRRN